MPVQLEIVRRQLADRYTVEKRLGKGGMSVVFLGRGREGPRAVAIKVLRPEFAVTILHDRFHREVSFLAALEHPNILPLIESGETGTLLYYVMPYAHGGSLHDRLEREGRLTLDETIAVTRQIAAALDYAHEHNIIHRDIKPENIMFDEGRAMLCDFGVARALVRAGGERISTSGLVVGTPTYMSPEQASGRGEIDHRSDVYSLACVIYQMVVGEPPFTGRTPQAVIARHVAEHPPSLRIVRPELPLRVEEVVMRGLAKEPGERWSSAGEMARELGGSGKS